MDSKIKCEICQKEFSKYGINTHIWRSHSIGINHDPNIGFKNGTRINWNKGLTKDDNLSIKKGAETLKNKYDSGELIHPRKGKALTEEHKEKLRKNFNKNISKNIGRGKKGWYKGYWCDSSWELAYVIYNLEHNIKFERNKKGFDYMFENRVHKYYPDFILEDGTYVEIKGYLSIKDKEKIKQFKEKIIIIDKQNMSVYLDYTINKYNKNFIDLYENNIKEITQTQTQIKRNKRKELIRESNIDFTKYGWGQKLSKLLNITSSKAIKWIKNNMKDELNLSF